MIFWTSTSLTQLYPQPLGIRVCSPELQRGRGKGRGGAVLHVTSEKVTCWKNTASSMTHVNVTHEVIHAHTQAHAAKGAFLVNIS